MRRDAVEGCGVDGVERGGPPARLQSRVTAPVRWVYARGLFCHNARCAKRGWAELVGELFWNLCGVRVAEAGLTSLAHHRQILGMSVLITGVKL